MNNLLEQFSHIYAVITSYSIHYTKLYERVAFVMGSKNVPGNRTRLMVDNKMVLATR